MRRLTFRPVLGFAALAILLSACTVMVTPGGTRVSGGVRFRTGPTSITRFEPDLGTGATYRTGDPITFRIRTDRPGYVTLTVTDPDGTRYELARDLRVRGDRSETLRGPGWIVVPPRGLHRVRASFTTRPRGRAASARDGRIGAQSIVIDPTPRAAGSTLETYFYLR